MAQKRWMARGAVAGWRKPSAKRLFDGDNDGAKADADGRQGEDRGKSVKHGGKPSCLIKRPDNTDRLSEGQRTHRTKVAGR